jgi:hypothetical protein
MTAQPPKSLDGIELDPARQPLDLGAIARGVAEIAPGVDTATSAPPATPDLSSFDLDAAWLRRAEADSAGFLSRFSRIVGEALPQHATLDIARRGIFRKTEEVVGLMVTFEDEIYRMRLSGSRQIVTEIEKRVRGITLSTRQVQTHTWISGLLANVHERTEKARGIAALLRSL